MRRPLGVAIRETARLDRPVRGEVVRRLPMALARRRVPHPAVEAALAALGSAEDVAMALALASTTGKEARR